VTFHFTQAFLGLFDRFLEFQEMFHNLHKGISMVFLTITMAFLSNGCFLAETIFNLRDPSRTFGTRHSA
jgi:hypothetical protein